MHSRQQIGVLFIASVLAPASMWFYVDRVLVPHQRADAAAHDRPRGNLSDLYPRWLGARELLLHHRNPYADDITLEIQKGYYGRVLDPARPGDPKDQQGFAYPVYVVFLLAPLVVLPFPLLHATFYWCLALLTASSVWLWLRVLRWRLPPLSIATVTIFMLGSFPAVQGIKLQQLSLVAAALLAASAAATVSGSLFLGGVLLALATIKPQLAWPLVAWLLLWAVTDWRARRNLLLGFGVAMAALLLGSEIILPGWWRMFAGAVVQYHHYTHNQSVLEVILNQFVGNAANGTVGQVGARLVEVTAILSCGSILWRLRVKPVDTGEFGNAIALVLALTVLVVPMFAPYNQVLLLPAILLLVRDREFFLMRSRGVRLGYFSGSLALSWQWIAAFSLGAVYLFGQRAWAQDRWQWPFFGTFALPVFVFALVFLRLRGVPASSSNLERPYPKHRQPALS